MYSEFQEFFCFSTASSNCTHPANMRQRKEIKMTAVTQLRPEGKNDMNASDKQKALDAALSQIEKAFGKGSIMQLGSNVHQEVEVISTGSLGLDIALGIGGLPRGRIIEIYGPESSGKTTLALQVI